MTALHWAAVLAFALGLGHSILGERFILGRLARRPDSLPQLFGGTTFTLRTLRFVWHLLTVFGWGFAALLWRAAAALPQSAGLVDIIAWTMMAGGLLPLVITRGQHLSWIVLFAIGGLALSQAG